MAKWEQLNEAGEVVQVVDWAPRDDMRYTVRERSCDCAKDAVKHEFIDCDHWTEREVIIPGDRPEDIPHKGVVWREHVEPAAPPRTREGVTAEIMAAYRDRILDAMPDMDAVRKVTDERDYHVHVAIKKEFDVQG